MLVNAESDANATDLSRAVARKLDPRKWLRVAFLCPALFGAWSLDFERRKMYLDIARIVKSHWMRHGTGTRREINFRQQSQLGFSRWRVVLHGV
jgi:hypothetical protein